MLVEKNVLVHDCMQRRYWLRCTRLMSVPCISLLPPQAVSAPQGVSVEGKKTPVTMEESFSRLASSRISTEDRDVSLTYDLPTDPAWRRKHILLTHVSRSA